MDVQKLIEAAVESEQYTPALASDRDVPDDGILFRGVSIVGFSNAEEELVQAFMSRIPPELVVNVNCLKADPSLDAIHGRYDETSKTILFNPKTFQSRMVLGRGPAKIHHAQLTMCHEFGHSLYNSLSEEVQAEWMALSGWRKGWKEGQEKPYEEKRPGWPHITSKWTHRKGAQFTRHYAEKNPDEDFSDTFAFTLLSKPAQAGDVKRKWMADLLLGMIRKYPQASLQGPEGTS